MGAEVEFNEMFVNILRKNLPQYEIFNLSHMGYGTDQSLLIFKQWHYNNPLKLVILMFFENDFIENNSLIKYDVFKPKYELYDDKLLLTNIPVPKVIKNKREAIEDSSPTLIERIRWLLAQSHFIRDVYYRIKNIKTSLKGSSKNKLQIKDTDFVLTTRLIRELRDEVDKRGGKLVVVAIPEKQQFLKYADYEPYQWRIESICKSLNIDCLDLAPYFKNTFLRTYYRIGGHWNKRGHNVAAEAIYDYLKKIVKKYDK